MSAAFFVLGIVQMVLAGLGSDNGAAFGGLHVLNAFVLTGLAIALLVDDRRALREAAQRPEDRLASAHREALELGREPGIRDSDRARALDRDAVLRDESRDRARACRCGGRRAASTRPPRSRAGTPRITQPSRVTRTCPPTARSSSPTVSRRFDSLTRELLARRARSSCRAPGRRRARSAGARRPSTARARARSRTPRARTVAPRDRRPARRRAASAG